jgi:Ala-tRNA(Pro) deacylase
MAIPSAISDYLEQNRVSYSVIQHPLAYTAQEGAAYSHVPGREWAKAVVCIADDEPMLAVLPAHYVVDVERLQDVVGAGSMRVAKESEIAGLYSDCEVGAMPPLGPLYGQRVMVDRSLAADPEIVFNGGSHRDAIRMRYADFAGLVKPTVADFGVPV